MTEHRPHSPTTVRSPLPSDGGDFTVVGIGASAGGLDASRRLLAAVPATSGMAFILVQHLDPTHESLMVDLLASHTSLTVLQATDGMVLARDHLYVIPPGSYLSVADGTLRLSQPQARHGARFPFDFLLHSLARAYGPQAACVILSGTGGDGSLGLESVKRGGGLVIAQDPEEAGYDGMPRSAIATGAVDLVLPAAQIPAALVEHAARAPAVFQPVPHWLPEIVDLLRTRTAHDFRLYKPGTLERRIERRAALAGIGPNDIARYLELLRHDADEIERLANDLLINVTSFFRDPKVFELLAEKVIPDLIRDRSADAPIRIWIAGCSTGEETYSLAMLFHEQIAASKRNVKLQIFASDVDPDAVAIAREGLYPETVATEIGPERLARFFSREERNFRISPVLRGSVVFTVQDLLADPPFSRLDLVSCRNLLIYLRPEAQAKIISLFHFALREGGVLLLGSSEAVGAADERFKLISKAARLYRHAGRSRRGEFGFAVTPADGVRAPSRAGQNQPPSRQASLAEICRRMVLETYAPAAVLINAKHECLFSLGPTDRYLRVAPGQPTYDLFSMARQELRTKLRAAIQQASQQGARVTVSGGRLSQDGRTSPFSIDVQPIPNEADGLLLISFVEERQAERKRGDAAASGDVGRVGDLELELAATRTELQSAIRNLEISSEEQRAINEEALSVNEEFQSTNEELLTSKEELQSLNEELTALNGQLQETLERQRTVANDLQNVLYSTDMATLFLDNDLHIRFFTPATRSLFNVLPGDVGRPLADLRSLASDENLETDARAVLVDGTPSEREIEARGGAWFVRRVLPYRAQDGGVEGIVVTFNDITERKQAAKALEAAKQEAELANIAKSRFLAAASHDLRQPLQTLALLQGLLAKIVVGDRAQKLVALLDPTLNAMSGMLNTLLDINHIDAGTVHAEIERFPLGGLFARLQDEFTYLAHAQGLEFRVVPCGLSIDGDPRLLEQMIRNLLSNAIKYTQTGKVLLGCRRHAGTLAIEIWDTGIGIPDGERQAIFEEYHQVGNAARERSRGLGLGLSIVQRLAALLGYRVSVRSQLGKGSVFAIEVPLPPAGTAPQHGPNRPDGGTGEPRRTGAVLLVEDDPELRNLLELFLAGEGHTVMTARDGAAAAQIVARGTIRPDLILADYNLPGGLDGIGVATATRRTLHRSIPVVILTGDISTTALREIARHDCVQLNKPVKLAELTRVIQHLLPPVPPMSSSRAGAAGETITPEEASLIYVVDDDRNVRDGIRHVLEEEGHVVEDYASCEKFLDAYRPGREACLLVDAYLPGMNGIDLLRRLRELDRSLPSIMITGNSDVQMAVQAMKEGASDFIEKPVSRAELLTGVARALEQSRDAGIRHARQEEAAGHVGRLTPRQRQIMELILAGHPNKNIAADLGISQRTVENHRASIMEKTGAKSLPALARLALAAVPSADSEPPVAPARAKGG